MTPELEALAAKLAPFLMQATEVQAREALRASFEMAWAMGACEGVQQVQCAIDAQRAIQKAAA